MRILKASDVRVWKKLLGNACFSAATASNDNSDLPVILLNRERTSEVLLQLDVTKREAADNALRSEAVCLVPAFYNVKIRSL